MGLLAGKVALITGAARGIGKAIALKFAAEGADVAFTDLVINEAAEETVAEIAAFGHKVKGYASNAASFDETQAVVEQVLADFGRVDILVNNAGITKDGLAMRMTEAQWDAVIAVNLKSAFNFIHAVLPAMARQRGGNIINMASIAGQMGNPGQCHRPGIHHLGDDQRPAGSRPGGIPEEHPAPPRRYARRHRECRAFPRLRPVLLCDRPGHRGQRRPVLLTVKNS